MLVLLYQHSLLQEGLEQYIDLNSFIVVVVIALLFAIVCKQ